jgi:hypothetical protein
MAKRLPASSLVEVTVAAAILVIVFGLALAVCGRLLRQGPSPRQLYAWQLAQALATQTIRRGEWIQKTVDAGELLLEQRVQRYQSRPYLYQLQVQALAQDSVLATYQELVYAPPADAP